MMTLSESISNAVDSSRKEGNEARALYWEGRLAALNEDYVKAAELYLQSAELGDPYGVCELSRCCRKGEGVGADQERALQLASQAADMGDYGGCCDMARSYCEGNVVAQDYKKGALYYERASQCKDVTVERKVHAFNRAGFCYYAAGKCDEALDACLNAISLLENEPEYAETYARSLEGAGFAKWGMGKFREAEEYWRREQQALYWYSKINKSFDYDTSPVVAQVTKNILAAEARIEGRQGVAKNALSILIDLLPKPYDS